MHPPAPAWGAGITPDIGARTTYGQPASRRVNAGFVNVYYDQQLRQQRRRLHALPVRVDRADRVERHDGSTARASYDSSSADGTRRARPGLWACVRVSGRRVCSTRRQRHSDERVALERRQQLRQQQRRRHAEHAPSSGRACVYQADAFAQRDGSATQTSEWPRNSDSSYDRSSAHAPAHSWPQHSDGRGSRAACRGAKAHHPRADDLGATSTAGHMPRRRSMAAHAARTPRHTRHAELVRTNAAAGAAAAATAALAAATPTPRRARPRLTLILGGKPTFKNECSRAPARA